MTTDGLLSLTLADLGSLSLDALEVLPLDSIAVLDPVSPGSGNGWFFDSGSTDAAVAVQGSTYYPTAVTSSHNAYAWWDLQTQVWNMASAGQVYAASSITVFLWAINNAQTAGGENVTIDLSINGSWVGPQTLPTNTTEGWVSVTFNGNWNNLNNLQVKAKYVDPNLWMHGCIVRRVYVSAIYEPTNPAAGNRRKYLFLLAMP